MQYFPKPVRFVAAILGLVLAGSVVGHAQAPLPPPRAEQLAQTQHTARMESAQAARLQRIMTPLIRHMDRPIPLDRVKIGLLDDPNINAANAGGGEFYVTAGLLQQADDDRLRAILAHEAAHADLGHVAKSQALSAGLGIGIELFNRIFPGYGALTPIAGQLVANGYSRTEETEADAHGVTILRRAGYDGKTLMANTLAWLKQSGGGSGGGFLATHPSTDDRIEAIRRLP